jgi:membrane dipeptidase
VLSGLSVQQEERARQIHDESIILLAHDHFFPPQDLDHLREGGITAKILLAVIDTLPWAENPEDYKRSITQIDGWFNHAQGIYEQILSEIEKQPELVVIRNGEDVIEAKKKGKIGILLGAEGGKLIEYDLKNLSVLYQMGLRHILLSWAYNNQITNGELDQSSGLTDFGRQVIPEMNRLGMIVDITHISRHAMREVLEISTKPVLNSHTALKSISHRIPAITEDEIRSVAEKGGVLALHFMTHMLTGQFEVRATLDQLMAQMDALVTIAGIDGVALGPDYLPYTDLHRRNTQQPNLTFPVGLESAGQMLNLTRALVQHGYDDSAIKKILGGNLMRLFRDTMSVA